MLDSYGEGVKENQLSGSSLNKITRKNGTGYFSKYVKKNEEWSSRKHFEQREQWMAKALGQD